MHEMSYMVRFVNIALKELEDHPEQTPKALEIEIGELTGLIPGYLKKYYPAATRGTRLAGTELLIRETAAEAECQTCGMRYRPVRGNDYRCPGCGGIRSRFLHGREALVSRLLLF